MKSTVMTEELLVSLDACQEAKDVMVRFNLYGKPLSEVLLILKMPDTHPYMEWWTKTIKTELFVRVTGEVIIMGSYQVFNPTTGLHVDCEDQESARAAVVAIAQELLINYPINILQCISNENGSTAWIPSTLDIPLALS